MIDGQNVFDQSVKSDLKTYDNIKKKLRLVKEMITQVIVCYIILVSKIL